MAFSINQILDISRSGMLTRLIDLDLTSNNLANISTTGYKTSRSNFQEMLNQKLLNGVQISSTQRFMDEGTLKTTSNALDLAIDGNGFFSLTLPDGTIGYTRAGEFSLDANRQIVNPNGYPLVWDGSIPEDATDVNIESDGAVMALQGDTWNQVGTIQLSTFPNVNGLQENGNAIFLETEVSGAPTSGAAASEGYGQIQNHALEQSNVSISNEIAELILLQRSYDLSLKTFQATDEMLGQALQMRRG